MRVWWVFRGVVVGGDEVPDRAPGRRVGATFHRDAAGRLLGADDARELIAKAEMDRPCAKMPREGMRYAWRA